MKSRFKTIFIIFTAALCFFALTGTKAFADGPPYAEIENNNSASDANQIVLFDAVNATLPKGDIDYYKIYLPITDTYEFYFSTTGTKTIDVTISDENNNIVFHGNPDANQRIIFDDNLQGLYYITVKDDQNVDNNNEYNFEFYHKNWNDNPIYRFAGNDRYETSFNILKNNWASCNYAVITTGEDFPDALSAAPLAKKFNAPIILTKPDALSSDVENQLKKAGVTKAFIIGGEAAVSKSVENKLASMGITCTRIAGADRYSTSLAVAKYLNPNGEAVIATGSNFPDALSIAPIAAKNEMPILLVDDNNPNEDAAKYIKDNGIKTSYIIGGTGVINKAYEDYLSQFTGVKRLSGSNRYETNISILTYFQDRIKLNEMYFATGENFPDALSGSVLAAAGNHPIVLVNNDPDISTVRYTLKNSGLGRCIFGGEGVIPDSVIKGITQ